MLYPKPPDSKVLSDLQKQEFNVLTFACQGIDFL